MDALISECYSGTLLVAQPIVVRRHLGFPPGGSFIPRSALLANLLVGQESQPVIETASRLTIVAKSDLVVGIASIAGLVRYDGKTQLAPCRLFVPAGKGFSVEPSSRGARYCIAVAGGWQVDEPVGNGNWQALAKGQELARLSLGKCPTTPLRLSPLLSPTYRAAVIGLDHPVLTEVMGGSDRRGVRLASLGFGRPGYAESRPCVVGTVQITPDGTMIIVGPDGPTIGGYAQLGVLASADIEEVGQWKQGDRVELQPSTRQEALERLIDQANEDRKLGVSLKLIHDHGR